MFSARHGSPVLCKDAEGDKHGDFFYRRKRFAEMNNFFNRL